MPVEPETADNGTDAALINGRDSIHDSRKIVVRLCMEDDGDLIREGSLGIRGHGRQHKGMRASTAAALYPADSEPDLRII